VSAYIAAEIELDGSQTLYLSIDAASGSPMNLSGYVELESAGAIYTQLTTLARVKRELGITTTTNDLLLSDLINGVSSRFLRAVGRNIVEAAISGEKLSGDGFTSALTLRHWPVTGALTLLDSEGDTVDAATYDLAAECGVIYSLAGSWARGTRNYSASYTAGYADIPAMIVSAVTAQVCHEYAQTSPGGGRRGVEGRSDASGTSETFDQAAFLPIFLHAIAAFRDAA
jgi:hypothetical protein